MQLEISGEAASEHGGLVTRCSLTRGRNLSPGLQRGPWYWRDVVHGPPPRRRIRGDAIHVTFHGLADDPDVRLGFTTVVRVDPGVHADDPADDIIHVEERLNLQRRVLHELVERERAFSDRLALRWRSRLAHGLASQRRFANARKTAWVAAALLALVRLQAKIGHAVIRGTRAFLRSLVAIPDAILSHGETASVHLASQTGRARLRRALVDPAAATPIEKSVVLVLVAFSLLGIVLLLNTLFAAVFVDQARVYQGVLADFTSSLLSTIALPIPAEPILILHGGQVGFAIVFAGLFLGKMVGSWILYLMGDSLNDGIQKKTAKSPRMERMVSWMQRNADKWGFWLLVPINAIPFLPDLLVLVFAVSGMRFRGFMGGIALGTILKFSAIIAGVYWLGPERIQAFLDNPIQSLGG